MSTLPGITRQDEENKLKRTVAIAEEKYEAVKSQVKSLADDLHQMMDEFDESDREMQALWNNTDARFQAVNQELKRTEQARKKPYFGRIDFVDKQIGKEEVYYIGRSVIAKDQASPEVIDWRAPIASVYYDHSLGDLTYSVKGEGRYEITLNRKRTYEIENHELKDYFDSDVVANDELLTKYLAKNKRSVLGEIIATIQQEQNEIIRKKPQHNLIVQGAAGSGKTTVAMHRISYILYNFDREFAPEDFYIIGSNQVLLQYITGVLPELDVYGVRQMTMEQLFVRLLYEDWNQEFEIIPVKKGLTPPVKGTLSWFQDLEAFCWEYILKQMKREDIIIEKTGAVLMKQDEIENIMNKFRTLSFPDLKDKLTEHLMARLENEISGKYYSYHAEEKKRMTRTFSTYFGKREWKGSIFDLYEDFLASQRMKGHMISVEHGKWDVYDLAALAYLYKRIKEEEVIREAGHVVIDEAQDFGMMAYACLKYCLSKCTYTIMGDVSQNISIDFGLNDWQELRDLMLPQEFDYFGLLRKSYRNTIEISDFATEILKHGSFQVYPVEPIIRHGKEVTVTNCVSFGRLVEESVKTIKEWQKQGLETIAVVCRDEEEVARVSRALSSELTLLPNEPWKMEFGNGVLVLSLDYTKGLEFDAVLIFNANTESYPNEDGYVKRLYVAATRALHELHVLYQGELTELIAKPVEESKNQSVITQSSVPKRKPMPEEPEKTHAELCRERAIEAEKEMAKRNQYGPRRIVIKKEEPEQKKAAAEVKKADSVQTRPKTNTTIKNGKVTSYLDRYRMELNPKDEITEESEFGEVPDQNGLKPIGHGNIDCGVRFVMKDRRYIELVCGYGVLRLTPVVHGGLRFTFQKGTAVEMTETAPDFRGEAGGFKYRETKNTIEMLTEKLWIKVDKKTGAVNFSTAKGKELLTENAVLPRQIEGTSCWEYLAFQKNERLIARGRTDQEFLKLGSTAKYISFGGKSDRMPGIASEKGYELLFSPNQKIMCCNIGSYGNYVRMEGTDRIDYYIRCVTGEKMEG